jgi:hypothetical protein
MRRGLFVRKDGVTAMGLLQNADNLPGAMRFAFHAYFSIASKEYSPPTWVNYRRPRQGPLHDLQITKNPSSSDEKVHHEFVELVFFFTGRTPQTFILFA